MFTITWQGGNGLKPVSPPNFEQTLDKLENEISETSVSKWLVRTVCLTTSLQALKISRNYVGEGKAVAISIGTLILTRVLTHKLFVQPKINRLRTEYRLLSGQLERQQHVDSGSLKKLHNMVGLENLKRHVEKIQQKMMVREMRRNASLECKDLSRGHMLFTGNPGTGKTMSSRLLTNILYELGIIKEDKIVIADRSRLVGEHVGHTAIKTEALVNSAQNGVLFIDEAYSLFKPGSDRDYGTEAIEKILVMLEDPKINTLVILAGYHKQMEQLIESNPGFKSRVPIKIHFDDYKNEQLIQIFQKMCDHNGYQLSDDAVTICKETLLDIKKQEGEHFANARSIRNFFESVQSAQECRLAREFGAQFDGNNGTPQEDSITSQGANSAHPTADVEQLMEFSVADLKAAMEDYQYQSAYHESDAWKDIYR
ncbi:MULTISPECIES: AAA family ATPase [unclassified Endozoicomonas]|uniref:AAA family ATPase n=1 Tax=unclassified Endozoicomonas TaxID=2644528 RepID=UPI003BAE6E71